MQIKQLIFEFDINLFIKFNPVKSLMYWFNSRCMNTYIIRIIDLRFIKLQNKHCKNVNKNKFIIDLVLFAYLLKKTNEKLQNLNFQFKKFIMNQIRFFFLNTTQRVVQSVIFFIFWLQMLTFWFEFELNMFLFLILTFVKLFSWWYQIRLFSIKYITLSLWSKKCYGCIMLC